MSEILDTEIESTLDKLPPGPWHSRGNLVLAGDVPVALVTLTDFRNKQTADELARMIAKLPDLLHLLRIANPEVMSARIDELETELAEAHKIIDEGSIGID